MAIAVAAQWKRRRKRRTSWDTASCWVVRAPCWMPLSSEIIVTITVVGGTQLENEKKKKINKVFLSRAFNKAATIWVHWVHWVHSSIHVQQHPVLPRSLDIIDLGSTISLIFLRVSPFLFDKQRKKNWRRIGEELEEEEEELWPIELLFRWSSNCNRIRGP